MINFFKKKKVDTLVSEMKELRPLPLGVAEFHEWSDRIIEKAMLPATPESLKFALAEMIMHIKPTEDHCDDGYFIKCLRKGAANQVAHHMMITIRDEAKARLAKEEEAKKPHLVENSTNAEILENK